MSLQLISSNKITCYYENDDSQLEIDYSRPQEKIINLKSSESGYDDKGFGFWSKYVAIMDFDSYSKYSRPFDDQYCFWVQCIFNGFFFMKILDQNQGNVAAIILMMKDDPISLTHDIHIFGIGENGYQSAQFIYNSNQYQNIWYYTSIIYQKMDQKLKIFTNFNNQIHSFDYKMMTDEITVQLGGYDYELYKNYVYEDQRLLFFKGYFSPLQEYDFFQYTDEFFISLFTLCQIQPQKTKTLIYDNKYEINPSLSAQDDFFILSYVYKIVNNRYLITCWVKQDYEEALRYYQNEFGLTFKKLRQTIFMIDSLQYILQNLQGDKVISIYYEVDFQNNNQTIIKLSTEFIKIPLFVDQYQDENLRQYDTAIIEKDNLYELSQQWHYLMIEYGRTPINGATLQFRIYFLNQEYLIYNLGTYGYNSQFTGQPIIQYINKQDDFFGKSRTKIRRMKFISGYLEDNNDFTYECHSSCKDCFGPTNSDCKSCYTEYYYALTQYNICDCMYLTKYVTTSQKCQPIENTQNLQIVQKQLQKLCNFGYFQVTLQNQFFCVQCPEYNEERLQCGDCYHQWNTWQYKPICSFDYIQQKVGYPFIKKIRQNINIDVYYLDDQLQLNILQGAADFCNNIQFDCQQSQNYHLGQQIRLKCKVNHFFQNNYCQICDPYCIDCSSEDICLNCMDNYYFNIKNKKCELCPYECLTCKSDHNTYKGFKCLTCIKQYTLTKEGICNKCGIDCEYCEEDYNPNTQQFFIRCLKCLDEKRMSIRFDGINCKLITINNCQGVLIVSKSQFQSYSSFTNNFIPSNDYQDEQPICGLCEDFYGYNQYYGICEPRSYDTTCLSSYLSDYLYNGIVYPYQYFCIVSQQYNSISIFGDVAESIIPNCRFSLNQQQHTPSFCLECKTGYYANRLNGQCFICPEFLNCQTCFHSYIKFNDQWKIKLIPINLFMKQQTNTKYFFTQDQSKNPQDYQLICSSCNTGFMLKNGQCIKYCDEDCPNCLYSEGTFQCQNCLNNNYHSQLSLIYNKCSNCPSYCVFCRERSKDEILILNSNFVSNQNNQIYSYQCLKPFTNNQNLFYDQIFGQFLPCYNLDACENTITFDINLYCSYQQYQTILLAISNLDEQIQFKMKNVLFDSLLQSDPQNISFQDLELDSKYEVMNKKFVRKVIINLTSNTEQICSVNDINYISQKFSKHVFYLIDVQLIISSKIDSPLKIKVYKELHFFDFSFLRFENIEFEIQSSSQQKIINIQGFKPIKLELEKIQFSAQSNEQLNYFVFKANQIYSTFLNGINFQNINFQSEIQQNIFEFQFSQPQSHAYIKNIQISNCLFKNNNIFEFKSSYTILVELDSMNISANLNSCSLLLSKTNQEIIQFIISNIYITGQIENSEPFITLRNIQNAQIKNCTLTQVKLIDSTFIQMEKNAILQNIFIDQCQVSGVVQIISNFISKEMSNQTTLTYFLYQIEVNNLILNYFSKIIYLQPFQSISSSVEIENIKFSNINIDNQLNTQSNSPLINILVQKVKIQFCLIQRGSGFIEFLLENIQKLEMKNLKATQPIKYQLHQFYECCNLNPSLYPSFIKLLDVKSIYFEDFILSGFNIINTALILYSSYSELSFELIFEFKNLKIEGNLIMVSHPDSKTSLIYIYSSQKSQVIMTNVTITRNQLHNYGQNLFINSAVGILINCPSGIIKLEQNLFNNNFATNTSDTIVYIFAKNIFMDSIVFINNSIYNNEQFIDNILLSFPRDQIVRQNNLKSIFPIISEVGNAYLQGQSVIIQNCSVKNSSGKNGVGFYIVASSTKIIGVHFKNLKTQFKNNDEHGSCIFIEIASKRSDIIIKDNTAENIITKDYGSFLYIKSDHDYLNLTLTNLTVKACISSKGSTLYASFQKTSLSNHLNIQNVVIMDGENAFYDYLKNMIQNPNVQVNIKNRVQFYIENSVLNLSNVLLLDVFYESLIYCNGQGNIMINKMIINNGKIAKESLLYIQPRNNLQTVISIKGLQVEGLNQLLNKEELCHLTAQPISSIKIQNMQCQVQTENKNIQKDIEYVVTNQDLKCLESQILYTNSNPQQAIMTITQIKESDIIQFQDGYFINNNISNSKSGIIFFQMNKQQYNNFTIFINNLNINNNQCGNLGCICLNDEINNNNYQFFNESQRILSQSQEQILKQLNFDIIIIKYQCIGNYADFGTCLFANQSRVLLKDSILSNNQARLAGGVIYLIGNASLLIVSDSEIMKNEASVAGAIYFENSISQDIKYFGASLKENQATSYGNDIVQAPSHLSISINNYKSIFNTYAIYKTKDYLYEMLNNSNNKNQSIFLPSGTQIKEYQKFNQQTEQLEAQYLTFRIIALNNQYSKQYNLRNSKCEIETKIFDIQKKEYIKVQNQTLISKNHINFNEITNDYNLDDLIIYFDSDYTNTGYLQLAIHCDSIKINQYDDNDLIVKSYHNNYKLLVNINTFKCRVGEIKSHLDMSCHECDSKLDQYSLKLNSNKCNIRDEQTTLNVTSYKLNLRQGFWRPQFDNNDIEECYNLKENCVGLWDYGDNSCFLGHIGALCEQCDIEDTRGQGRYSNSLEYSCGSCEDIQYNLVQIIGLSIWTLITIILSVKGAITIEFYFLESPYLIKIFTNYLQIISSLTTFKLNLPINYFYFLDGVGSPIQRISYSMDCYLILMSSLNMHYIRLIWQLILPCIYFLILAIFYSILIYLNYIKYRGPIVMTAIIYMYIYFQPSLIGSIIALVSTRTISGIPWIQANVAFQFNTYTHQKWVFGFCIPILFFFGILIPFGLLYGLYKQRDKLIYKRGKSLFGYLYYEYKPKAYFWEIIKIVTKELVILFLIFYEDSIIIKGSLIYFILLFYQLLNLKYQPFKSYSLNNLDYESTLICGVSIILAIGLNQGQQFQFKSINNIYFFALMIINIFILVKLLIYIINSYINEMEEIVDLIKKKILTVLPKQLKISQQCQRILEPQAERRKRVKNNFKRLKTAFKQSKQKQNTQINLFTTFSTQQITQRINSQITDREQRQSQKVLLSDTQYK
ncbi:unnamed protein product [Paramecium sonneborni]|uniref:Uncharacterized protein n=1 Tax=Paramecium sonneborni TaxID=65129 RepID=A0A8S1QLY3_9CILI|nr:unnamed protein product [Paramecium sonneborni]